MKTSERIRELLKLEGLKTTTRVLIAQAAVTQECFERIDRNKGTPKLKLEFKDNDNRSKEAPENETSSID